MLGWRDCFDDDQLSSATWTRQCEDTRWLIGIIDAVVIGVLPVWRFQRSHTKFYHRFHVVWTTKYRYKVMRGEMRERIREIIIQTCQELGVHIEKGVLSTDHVHMFISVPPQIALSKVMMRIKGRSSYKIQREFPELRKRYWGQRFWARGFFSTTSGNVTDAVILQYLELHSKREPTGVSR